MKFFFIDGISRKYIAGVFVLKLFAGFVMFLLYSYYFDKTSADIFRFFDDAKVIYKLAFDKPFDYIRFVTGVGTNAPDLRPYIMEMNNWGVSFTNRIYGNSRILIQLNSIVMLFSFGNYFIHSVFMCFISLLGLTAIYKFFESSLKNKKWELFFIVFLIPSVVYWGSGVLKEGLMLFGIGFLIYYFKSLINKENITKSIIWIFISIYLLSLTKLFVISLLIPLLLGYFLIKKTKQKYVGLKYLTIIIVSLFLGLNLHFFSTDLNVCELISRKQNDFIALAIETQSNSLITTATVESNFWSMAKAVPKSFYNSLFQPNVFNANSIFMKFSAIENLLIIISIILMLIFIKIKGIDKNTFYFSLVFAICSLIIIGFTPIAGAIVRYKIIAIPFLLISLLMVFDKEKFVMRFSKSKNKK